MKAARSSTRKGLGVVVMGMAVHSRAVSLKCPMCGVSFGVLPSIMKDRCKRAKCEPKDLFCSNTCATKYRWAQRRGELMWL